jgi:hypothetical protein
MDFISLFSLLLIADAFDAFFHFFIESFSPFPDIEDIIIDSFHYFSFSPLSLPRHFSMPFRG